jgi:hypothetical protein
MDVADRLRGLGLERYEAALHENGVNAEVLCHLTAEALPGHSGYSLWITNNIRSATIIAAADTMAASKNQSHPVGLITASPQSKNPPELEHAMPRQQVACNHSSAPAATTANARAS